MPKNDSSSNHSQQSSASDSLASILPRSKTDGIEKERGLRKKERGKRSASSADSERPPSSNWPGGSWRGKTAAVAGLTQSISASASTAVETALSQIPSNIPPSRPFQSLRTPSKSAAAAASTTRLSVTANAQEDNTEEEFQREAALDKGVGETKSEPVKDTSQASENIESPQSNNDSAGDASKERPMPPAGWLGWWTKPLSAGSDQEETTNGNKNKDDSPTDELRRKQSQEASTPQPIPQQTTTMAQGSPAQGVPGAFVTQSSPGSNTGGEANAVDSVKQQQQRRSSWFGYWTSSTPGPETQNNKPADQDNDVMDPVLSSVAAGPDVAVPKIELQHAKISDSMSGSDQGSGSWAFWSKERPKSTPTEQAQTASDNTNQSEQSSNVDNDAKVKSDSVQTNEKLTKLDSIKGKSKEKTPVPSSHSVTGTGKSAGSTEQSKISESSKTSSMPPSKDPANSEDQRKGTAKAASSSKTSSLAAQDSLAPSARAEMATEAVQRPPTPSDKAGNKAAAQNNPNLVLPTFHDTYSVAVSGGYWQRLMEMLGRGLRPEEKHVSICPRPHRIRKAVVVGVHGLFPGALFQKVLGAPKGTSIRFANGAAAALQRWTSQQGYSCNVEKVALEGEGLIADRIDILWKLLLKWADDISKADFVIIACHSQGVPVSIVLMSKLIELGYIGPQTRLSICSMAGVSLGPFPSYIGKLFGASATELFSFSNPTSSISTTYVSALSLCVRHHVRIAYIGSIDDQLVSIESAVFATVSHPYIYRAVFVDGRIHAPDFLTKLVGFAMKLRNLGVSDHGLIRELSAPLAGSLYSGEGHSRVYEEDGVYDVAIQFALESTKLVGDVPDLVVKEGYEVPTATNTNPYFLPWAMRGVLEEEVVRSQLKGEAEELLRLFEEWKPASKVLKDVRFRLEAVRSLL